MPGFLKRMERTSDTRLLNKVETYVHLRAGKSADLDADVDGFTRRLGRQDYERFSALTFDAMDFANARRFQGSAEAAKDEELLWGVEAGLQREKFFLRLIEIARERLEARP